MKWVGWIRRRAVALFLLIGILVVLGAWRTAGLPSAIFPSVTFPIVKVIADVGDEPAARMMPTVTRPLERAILRVPGIEQVRSTTSRGSTEISASFRWGTDMQVALERVQAETQRIRPDLPSETRIDVEWMNPASFPIEGYALTSDVLSQAQLRAFADYTLAPTLFRIPGVAQVQVQGGRQREFQIHLSIQALWSRHLTAQDVIAAIRADDQVQSAGLTERNHELYLTLVDGRARGIASLEQIAIPMSKGPPVPLGELGTVRSANEISFIRTTAQGHPAVLVNLVRQPNASTVAIADAVKQLFRDRPDLLPKGVTWTPFYDQAAFVRASVAGTRDAILIGVALAFLVLLIFLRSFRRALVAVLAIPVTVAIVGLLLAEFGQTINLMTLAGVAAALGLIADDAIVVIEDIHHHAEGESEGDFTTNALRGLLPALVGSSLSTIVILLPFALLTGVVGAFFKPLALTMALSLLVSFFIAVIAVPIAASFGRARARAHPSWRKVPKREGWSRRGYARVVGFFVDFWPASIVLLVGLLVAAWALYRGMGTDFLPSMDEGAIILDYWTPPGTSLTDTNQMLDEMEKVIMSLPDVASYSRRTGTQLGFFITEPNTGDYVISLKPRGERRPIDEVMDLLRTRIAQVEPAVHTDFGQILEDNIGDLTGGEPQPIDVKLFGSDQAMLEQKARELAKLLDGVRGVEDVFDGIVIAGPSLDLRVNSANAARYGLTTADLQSAVEPAINGTVASQLRIGERMYDVRVFAPGGKRLGDLPIRGNSPTSALLPLSELAKVVTGPPETEIDRENLSTYVGVTARLSGRDLGGAISEIKNLIRTKLHLPTSIHVAYGGLYAQQQQSFTNLLYVLIAGLVLVSVVVLFEFGDWRAPIVVVLAALASLAGVLAALGITGTTLNISSYVGAIMMVGIVGENAIFVIHDARLRLRAGDSPREAWRAASFRRLRPVAMTILATAFALAPLALDIGQGAQLIQPLAIAVIGGFALSGVLVLFFVPGFYRLLDPHGALARH